MSMPMAVGMEKQVRGLKKSNGQYTYQWKVTRFGKVLAEGGEDTEKMAEKAAWNAIKEVMETKAAGASERKKAMLKIRDRIRSRPYLVEGVTYFILYGTHVDKVRVMDEAADWEQDSWLKDPPKYRKPLSHHPLAVTPRAGGEKLFEDFTKAGLIKVNEDGMVVDTTKLKTWAFRVFGAERMSQRG